MYLLVNDVAAYPQFLPWCVGADVLNESEREMQARLRVRKGRFNYAFTTRNLLDAGRAIELSLVDGPFRTLNGAWHFEPTDGGCLIRLDIEFEFGRRLLGAALAATFKTIANSLVDAFKSRAYAVYGG